MKYFRLIKTLGTVAVAGRYRCNAGSWAGLVVLSAFSVFAGYTVAQSQIQPPDDPIANQRAVIRFLTADDYPPFNSRDEEGVLTGLNIDLARSICLDLAATCDIQVRPWSNLLEELAAGKADAVIAAHRVTAEALENVDFTERYFHTPARF